VRVEHRVRRRERQVKAARKGFALNRKYLLNDKTALAEVAEFAIAPKDFVPRVQKALEWGTGLRPFLQPLDDAERTAFLARYTGAIEATYPALPDGTVLLPFPRLFFVALRSAA
jgi:trans-aconitate methyltransferase